MRVSLSVFLLVLLVGCGGGPDSPLIGAARQGDVAEVRRCLAVGANPNETGGVNGWTALMHAVHKHQVLTAVALLEGGADPNARVGKGITALMMAAGYGHTEMVRALLERGADPRLTTRDGDSALEAAVSGVPDIDKFTLGQCQTPTVKALLDKDPTLQIRDSFWGNLSKRVAKIGGCAETLKLLEGHRRAN